MTIKSCRWNRADLSVDRACNRRCRKRYRGRSEKVGSRNRVLFGRSRPQGRPFFQDQLTLVGSRADSSRVFRRIQTSAALPTNVVAPSTTEPSSAVLRLPPPASINEETVHNRSKLRPPFAVANTMPRRMFPMPPTANKSEAEPDPRSPQTPSLLTSPPRRFPTRSRRST